MVSSNAADDDDVSHPARAARWVVFVCAGRRYGFPLEHVSEIVAPRPFTRLPGTGQGVCGLVGVRGRAVTVLDLGTVLSEQPAARLADHRLLLLELEERRIGFAVDEIVAIRPAHLQPPSGDEREPRAMVGTAEVEGVPFVALDPVRLTEDLLQHV